MHFTARSKNVGTRLARLLLLLFGFLFFVTDSLAQKKGDLDGDDKLTVVDLVRLINHVKGSAPLPPALLDAADFNGDRKIDHADVNALANAIAGIIAPVVQTEVVSASVSFLNGAATPVAPGSMHTIVSAAASFLNSAAQPLPPSSQKTIVSPSVTYLNAVAPPMSPTSNFSLVSANVSFLNSTPISTKGALTVFSSIVSFEAENP